MKTIFVFLAAILGTAMLAEDAFQVHFESFENSMQCTEYKILQIK
jgi:hypothetical protein